MHELCYSQYLILCIVEHSEYTRVSSHLRDSKLPHVTFPQPYTVIWHSHFTRPPMAFYCHSKDFSLFMWLLYSPTGQYLYDYSGQNNLILDLANQLQTFTKFMSSDSIVRNYMYTCVFKSIQVLYLYVYQLFQEWYNLMIYRNNPSNQLSAVLNTAKTQFDN